MLLGNWETWKGKVICYCYKWTHAYCNLPWYHLSVVFFFLLYRFIEGILRSINNMLEHFHQSFFLYVLPNTHRYISIGMYMPPLACLLLPLLVKLFMLWADIFRLDAEITSETENVTNNVYVSPYQYYMFCRLGNENLKMLFKASFFIF